jgi:hypothetical protein
VRLAHNVTHRLNALAMAAIAIEPATLRPTPIAVHDDGDVVWDGIGLHARIIHQD